MSGARYLAFEGLDGAGKTTQLKRFLAALERAGIAYVSTKEPGGTPTGELLRKILLTGSTDKLTPISEAFLFSANRAELMHHVVRPSLAAGRWVVSDRTFLTTLAIQGYARGMDLNVLKELTQLALNGTIPDLFVVLDLDPAVGLARKHPQLGEGADAESRFESFGLDFHKRIREGYHDYAAENPERVVLIDADGSEEDVQARIFAAVKERLGLELS